MEAYSEYQTESTQLKGSIRRIQSESKISRRASVMRYNFDKIADIQYLKCNYLN